jgi:hypothetical protein
VIATMIFALLITIFYHQGYAVNLDLAPVP